MHKNKGAVYYGAYLKLKQLLNAQTPLSKLYGEESHDEMLFILVHQTYELWFKQILHELKSIQLTFQKQHISAQDMHATVRKLDRIYKIQQVMQGHLKVLETMTPMDFLEFRDLLVPASGFQSVQFREIEIRMGLSTKNRQGVDRKFFTGRLSDEDAEQLKAVEKESSLFQLLQIWLERMPFTTEAHFDFWNAYEKAVQKMLEEEANLILQHPAPDPDVKAGQEKALEGTKSTFSALFDEEKYLKLQQEGHFKLSRKALMNALFILLYRDEPLLQQPFECLNLLMDIDEQFTAWRYSHALMAQRMLGSKIGTGGSSGHQYLKRTTQNNRVFDDLFNLSTFLLPKAYLPSLPKNIKDFLNFNIESTSPKLS
ncbi:tryptophan 2,3-dioxygenase family protein [Persicobacter diffluens]|uniref:Tryptophan 2,3-dioxygenase n=1 Tax=Persicobacter diffluens TaxID=981 RepID=A0AAN5AMT5_9BACT|nr:hypothetical protein PEDI_32480 [Persicobacter diffluens]